MEALKNIVSREVREALKILWDEINKRFDAVNQRFEKMEMRFKEIGERFDRNEKRVNERLDRHERRMEKQLAARRAENRKQLDEQKEFFQQLLSSLEKKFDDEKSGMIASTSKLCGRSGSQPHFWEPSTSLPDGKETN